MHSDSDKTLIYAAIGAVLFHGLLFFLYLNFVLLAPETRNIVISNVDLLLQEKEARVPRAPGNKTLDFLKLALPKIPKIEAAPAPKPPVIDIKAPEARRKNFELPQKLLERSGRVQAQERLDMNAARRETSALSADLGIKAERSAAALAPKIELEEVGMKRAPTLPDNLKFDENARSFTPQTMQELNIAVDRAKKVSALPQGLSERQGGAAAMRESARLAPAMPERLAEARVAPAESLTRGLRAKPSLSAAGLGGLKSASMKQAEETKKVEIEGPLSKRKVLKYFVPDFPAWARERGLLEASVAIKFYVDNTGRVLDNASVEKTSGYGALDRSAMEAIKRWRFEPFSGAASRQWGIITFRFVTD
ncbi:MAG: energy transducer TonB [Elusimicrobiales bacterium]|jgi:TonB family protein